MAPGPELPCSCPAPGCFPPKTLEFAEDTYIQETMSSYAHSVKKKRKEKKSSASILSTFPACTK